MSVFKYVTADGTLRYLRTWALRITPADQFNDPFEMRPTFDLSASRFTEMAPSIVRQELAAKFSEIASQQEWGRLLDDASAFSDALVAYLMRQMSPHEEAEFLRAGRTAERTDAADALQSVRLQFDMLYKQSMDEAQARLPALAKLAQATMHRTLPRLIGVLCLTGTSKHPLMWAHYTDSHKGALLEFDEGAPCFNRRRHDEDEFGMLRRVWYSDTRPSISDRSDADAVVALALTKALEWAYEQELRLLWPLELADGKVDSQGTLIHLIDVPATALRSVTIGCRASEEFSVSVLQAIEASNGRIAVRAASIDEQTFSLNYRDLR